MIVVLKQKHIQLYRGFVLSTPVQIASCCPDRSVLSLFRLLQGTIQFCFLEISG